MFMRKALFGASLFGTLASIVVSGPTVYASSYSMEESTIVLNGKEFSTQYKFVGGTPATTYMPIYYVQQLLDKVLGTSVDKWNGVTYSWHIDTLNATGYGSDSNVTGTLNDAVIIVNGVIAQKRVPILRAVDPSSGKQTTFMPVWYIQQVLNKLLNLNVRTDSWNGSSWRLTVE